jgi:hypothetical protein
VFARPFHLRASECASAHTHGSARLSCRADEGSPTRPTDTPPAAARLRRILGTLMPLHFPNPSRNYNPTQHCVCFWGYDSAFEISFHLDEDALCKVSPHAARNEASFLHVFDVNRVRIQEAASVAYSRRRRNYHRLSAEDLVEPVHRGKKHGQW